MLAHGAERIERWLLEDADDVFDASLAVNGLIVSANSRDGATRRGGVRIENHCVAGRSDIHHIAAQRGDGMSARGDGADDAEGCVFLEGDTVVPAVAVGPEPIHAGNKFDDLELLDLMVEPADFRFLKFESAPLGRVRVGEGLDDFFNLPARGDAFLLQLEEGFLRGSASFVGVLKHAKLAAQSGTGAGVCLAVATTRWLSGRRRGRRRFRCRRATETAQHFAYNITD